MKFELKNYLHKNESKYCLVGKIKGLAEENKRATFLIKNKKYRDGKAWILFRRKERLSYSIRYHLLAYGFLTGKPYSLLEVKCREDNKPNAKIIYNVITEQLSSFYLSINKITEEVVSKWLET